MMQMYGSNDTCASMLLHVSYFGMVVVDVAVAVAVDVDVAVLDVDFDMTGGAKRS